jgi:hypothetical protein
MQGLRSKSYIGAVAAVVCAFAFVASPTVSHAEDINEIFKRVNEFVTQKNYPKALEELNWAKKEIEKMNSSSLTSFFPDSLAGFTGAKAEVSNALGMTNISRRYSKGEKSVNVSLTGGGPAGALGGLAGIGKMAAMFGGEAGQDTFRLQGRTAMLRDDGGAPELQVFLDSGSILTLSGDNATGAELRGMAEALKLDALDSYLRGQAK